MGTGMQKSTTVSGLLGTLKFVLNICFALLFVTFILALIPVLPPHGIGGALIVLLPVGAILCWHYSRKVLDRAFEAAYRQAPALLRRPSLARLRKDRLAKWTVFGIAASFIGYGLFGLFFSLAPILGISVAGSNTGISDLGIAFLIAIAAVVLRVLTIASIIGIIYLNFSLKSVKTAIRELEMLDMMQDAPPVSGRRRHVPAFGRESPPASPPPQSPG